MNDEYAEIWKKNLEIKKILQLNNLQAFNEI